jgi:hypothetical protein
VLTSLNPASSVIGKQAEGKPRNAFTHVIEASGFQNALDWPKKVRLSTATTGVGKCKHQPQPSLHDEARSDFGNSFQEISPVIE